MKIGIDMKYNYLILALATVALFSCTGKEAVDPESQGELVTIRAYQEGATETRTTLIDGGTHVYWEPSDEITVFFRGTGSRFLSQNTSNADVAEFSGTMSVVVGINEGAAGSSTLWGLYPYRADATSDGESVTTTLPSKQTGRAGSFAKNTNITLAQSNSFDLAFYNVTGGIRFSLTQEGVKEVVFESQNEESIAGKVKLGFVDGIPVVQEVIEGQKAITLTAPGGGAFETSKWYYIVALPGTLSGGFKMTFKTDTQYATLKSSGSKTIKRGIFGSLADADEDLIYKDMGGDEPQTGNIVFADAVAKYACVAKYDTNGDGEVSIEEAEVATSFEGLFTDWKDVASFDEIKYFKNVHSLSGVFNGCSKLVSISVPETITDLGTYAFSGCSSLTSVELPSGITAIGDYTFQDCSSLTSVTVPEGVTSVGDYAFSGVNMWKLELPSSLLSLGAMCFGSIVCVLLPSNSPVSIHSNTFNGVWGIFVPSNLIDMYCVMTNWANYASKLHPIDTYREKSQFTLATSGAVDMGTSVKWAAYNLGATKPEEYGGYYAWGETQTKTIYRWITYKWCNGGSNKLTKYCPTDMANYWDGSGSPDGKTVLDLEDDAARANWNDPWRMPTYEEWKELGKGCLWEWTTYEGFYGEMIYCFENGNSIFLPAAGYRSSDLSDVGSYGYYWSSSLYLDSPYYAWHMSFRSDDDYRIYNDRFFGFSVRPVCTE